MTDPYWTYIDKLRGQIDELKAGVDFYEEVLRLRAEKIDLMAALAEMKTENERLQDGVDELAGYAAGLCHHAWDAHAHYLQMARSILELPDV